MSDPAFLAMRAGLVERGLLDEDFSLTDVGHSHCEALIRDLRRSEGESAPDRDRVRWNYRPGARRA